MTLLAVTGLTAVLLALGAAGLAVWSIWKALGPWLRERPPLLPLHTSWSTAVDSDNPLPDYPRPQLRRERWKNLNGVWDFAIRPLAHSADADSGGDEPGGPLHGEPDSYDGKIVVPFPVESSLSGLQHAVTPEQRAWYRRSFESPALPGERLILHFGAVDHEAAVWLNGYLVGRHRGGFTPFSFDITDALVEGRSQELVVAVTDPTDEGDQPRGKQSLRPKAIWYTAVTGIWQTVWIEPVPPARIEATTISTELEASSVSVQIKVVGAESGDRVDVVALAGGRTLASCEAVVEDDRAQATLEFDELRRWSPEDPFLYDLRLTLRRGDDPIDSVESYFGAREISTARDTEGVWRLCLNGQPLFHLGLLDQGWWPDGLYTAPTDEALAYDIEITRRMGFNTIRKHAKVEPARWYWHCDRLGVLVWQDMPSGSAGAAHSMPKEVWWSVTRTPPEKRGYKLTRTPEKAAEYRTELGELIDALESFPSIVVWVPFNEAWGQFDTDTVLAEVSARDPSRLVDGPSGWLDTGSGDMRDHHAYFGMSAAMRREPGRPVVFGEFGGLAHEVSDHLAVERGFGYRVFERREEFETAYAALVAKTVELKRRGLAGAIYTQTTDVEGEINGLLTYDRAVCKIEPGRMQELHRALTADD